MPGRATPTSLAVWWATARFAVGRRRIARGRLAHPGPFSIAFGGVRRRVHGLEPPDADLRVNLRGAQVDVAEHFLDVPDVGAVFQHQGGHGVPKQVAGALLAGLGSPHVTTHHLGQPVHLDRFEERLEHEWLSHAAEHHADPNAHHAPKPRTSNTRLLTPPRPPFVGESANSKIQLAPLLLQSGVDWLTLAFRVSVPHRRLVLLDRALGQNHHPAAFELGSHMFELSRFGRRGERFRLANPDLSRIVGPDRDGFDIAITLHALHLRTTRLQDALSEALALATELATEAPGEMHIRRLDVFADASGLGFDQTDEACFISRARRAQRFHAPDRVFTRKVDAAVCCSGFVFAPGNVLVVRIYDKTLELLAVHGLESQKTRTELRAYRARGWDGTDSVWRVEAQLRTKKLRRLGILSPADLLEKLDSVWHHVVGEPGDPACKGWLRHVCLRRSTRPERCPTSEKWRVFQGARFVGQAPLERADGNLGGAPLLLSLGMVHSTLGAGASLPPGGRCFR